MANQAHSTAAHSGKSSERGDTRPVEPGKVPAKQRLVRKHHPADDLSFTRIRLTSELKGTKLLPRCWWSVTASGGYAEDCDAGRHMALEYLEYVTRPDTGPCLVLIVEEMPAKLTGIEVGFLEMLDFAAAAGRARAVAISSYWDSKQSVSP